MKTLDVLKEFANSDIYIFVNDEEERAIYQKHNHGVNVIATGTKGITPARNFILNFFPEGERIMMMDDDIDRFDVMKIIELKKVIFQIVNVKEFIEQGFELCERIGAKLWGVQMCPFVTFMTRKINDDKFIIGTAMGIINNDLRFDETIKLKEDYDFTLQNMVKYGKTLRFNFVSVMASHYGNKGGCVDYRTEQLESDAVDHLLAKYPTKLIKNIKRKNEVIII
jgi:hypothetical protein